ncbi:MAG: hypothetical protein QME41_07395 [Actinomycetota bacterium]|nr:hypothetical protein [Actinomycetota bacterium]
MLYAEINVLEEGDIESLGLGQEDPRSFEPHLIDPRMLRRMRTLAARRGVSRQSAVQAWVQACLEVEFRKMIV